jgi:NADPH-dependent 2,4-dienoyl-CoA reductase/sulfur reductase-like enzyme
VARFTGASNLRVEGVDRAEAAVFTARGRTHRIACDTVLLLHGVVPNTQASWSLTLPHRWNTAQRSFRPVVDALRRSGLPAVFIAGARAAPLTGQLAALAIARDLGRLSDSDRDLAARPLRLRLAQESAARPVPGPPLAALLQGA